MPRSRARDIQTSPATARRRGSYPGDRPVPESRDAAGPRACGLRSRSRRNRAEDAPRLISSAMRWTDSLAAMDSTLRTTSSPRRWNSERNCAATAVGAVLVGAIERVAHGALDRDDITATHSKTVSGENQQQLSGGNSSRVRLQPEILRGSNRPIDRATQRGRAGRPRWRWVNGKAGSRAAVEQVRSAW